MFKTEGTECSDLVQRINSSISCVFFGKLNEIKLLMMFSLYFKYLGNHDKIPSMGKESSK